MRPKKWSYTPADDSTTGFKTGATGAGPFTPSPTSSSDSLAHLVSLTSAADVHTITVTLTGTDADGNAQTETMAAPTSNTVYSTKYFKTLTSVAVSSTLGANTMDIGWKDACIGPTIPLNPNARQFQAGIGVDISGTIDYTIQHTFQDVQQGSAAYPSTLQWFDHDTLVAQTADQQSNYSVPVRASRVKVNSLTAGATIALTLNPGGV